MKQLLFIGLLTLALGRSASAQPSSIYINNGTIIAPPAAYPQVDATNFVNTGLFNMGLSEALPLNLFEFSDVLNYTNTGVMACNTGFEFDTEPSSTGSAEMASNFVNAATGSVSAGSATNGFFAFSTNGFVGTVGLGAISVGLSGFPIIDVSAANIGNSGLLDAGESGVISLEGVNMNLDRGTVHIEGFEEANTFFSSDVGIFNTYWGLGLNTNAFGLPFGQSPSSKVTSSTFHTGSIGVFPPFPVAYANTNIINASNFTYQVVFVNTNVGISTDVRFEPASDLAIPIIQWLAVVTNAVTGQPSTNTLYLSDSFGAFTNFQLVTNSITLGGAPQSSPENYTFETFYGGTLPGYTNLPHGDTGYTTNNIFGPAAYQETNQYSAYGVNLLPLTFEPDPNLQFSTITNLPGRILLNASNYMDLKFAKVTGANYLNLASPNHFAGSAFAQIDPPYMDINLGTTNGQLNITNLVSAYITRFDGTIEAYSARWTNIVKGVTNSYHVLIVDSEFSAVSPVYVENFQARSTNVVISDALNVVSNILINAQCLTVSSNGPGTPTPFGQINLLAPNVIWSSSLPVLQTLTNSGIITVPNTTYFLGVRQPPYYTSTFDQPYQAFVNHGSITTSGDTTWATYFENTGFGPLVYLGTNNVIVTNVPGIISTFGPISLQANTAVMANSEMVAPAGDITIDAGTLSVSNHSLLTGGALTLNVTNMLNCATNGSGAVWSNFWSDGNGFNLPIKPPTGDLLGTTVTNFCPGSYAQVVNTWAGQDRGTSVAGFTNNVAVGHLILNAGDTTSTFFFTGASVGNALYVDLLELQNGATNVGTAQAPFPAIVVDTNMMIYYADAIAGGQDISERLDGSAGGGRMRWVSGYAGLFSGTNVVVGGVTHPSINRALVTSGDIDSNGSGTNNYIQLQNGSYPMFTSANVNFTVVPTNHLGTNSMLISWESVYNSTNFLRYKTSLTSTNWITLTNFVQGPANSRVTVIDPVQTSGGRFYKVEIDPQQP